MQEGISTQYIKQRAYSVQLCVLEVFDERVA